MRPETEKKGVTKDTLRFILAVGVLVLALALCAFLLVLFHVVDYLPLRLLIVLRVLCLVAIGLSINFFRAFLQTV